MLKLFLLPIALALIGLVAVAVFAPRNKEVKRLAEGQKPISVWSILWPLSLLATFPFLVIWIKGESLEQFSWMLYTLYLLALAMVGLVVAAWHGSFTFFVAAIPAAQEFGQGLTKTERRATWRRAEREFQKFRTS